jgi:single-stranded DNA-specific DHH superfamily exonuclease
LPRIAENNHCLSSVKSKLDLVALGTVADIMRFGENRILVQRGGIEIAQTSRIGLKINAGCRCVRQFCQT